MLNPGCLLKLRKSIRKGEYFGHTDWYLVDVDILPIPGSHRSKAQNSHGDAWRV